MRVGAKLALAAAMLALSASAFAAKKVDLDYHCRASALERCSRNAA